MNPPSEHDLWSPSEYVFRREVNLCPVCGRQIDKCGWQGNEGLWSCYKCQRTFTAPVTEVRRYGNDLPYELYPGEDRRERSGNYVVEKRIVPKNICEVRPFVGEYYGGKPNYERSVYKDEKVQVIK